MGYPNRLLRTGPEVKERASGSADNLTDSPTCCGAGERVIQQLGAFLYLQPFRLRVSDV